MVSPSGQHPLHGLQKRAIGAADAGTKLPAFDSQGLIAMRTARAGLRTTPPAFFAIYPCCDGAGARSHLGRFVRRAAQTLLMSNPNCVANGAKSAPDAGMHDRNVAPRRTMAAGVRPPGLNTAAPPNSVRHGAIALWS